MIGYLSVLQPDACAHIAQYGLVIYEAQCPMMVTEFPKNSIFDVVEFLGNTFVSEIFVGYFIYFLHIACMKKCWKTFRAHFFGTYTIQTVKKNTLRFFEKCESDLSAFRYNMFNTVIDCFSKIFDGVSFCLYFPIWFCL